MIRHLYVSTVDRKGHSHSYKLRDNEPLPPNEEVTDMRVAGEWSIRHLIRPEQQKLLTALFPRTDNSKQRRRARRAQA